MLEVHAASNLVSRAEGALVGLAIGDALGVPYELAPTLGPREPVRMSGGGLGPYQPGEWSDETQMAICLAEVTVAGGDPQEQNCLEAFAQRLLGWARGGANGGATDMGALTSQVLHTALADPQGFAAEKIGRAAKVLRPRSRRSPAGDVVALSPVCALAQVRDQEACAHGARAVATLLTDDELVADACSYWAELIRRAVLGQPDEDPKEADLDPFSRIDFYGALEVIPTNRREQWLTIVESSLARFFTPPQDNGFATAAISAAIGAISLAQWEAGRSAPARWEMPTKNVSEHPLLANQFDAFTIGVEGAVRIGGDTDTVAALTGALLGAAVGVDAIPERLREKIHGWPGCKVGDLKDLAAGTVITACTPNRLASSEQVMEVLEAVRQRPMVTSVAMEQSKTL
ncbi:hypothetical protein BK816_00130 [Boudabousia tangfeifanii]|uniref:ADP-ribosylglycohydrolase n=1 Tax=Boudabousia tangfeifanii TaxID=1912795 RepID=A0A1D9MI74_9ACTO|nr:ADP-ribosylglycohydrolase family protein [Boudabousia tangfeifanii]AOZ71889.1 hypothetical protein BK816_00130 [Boudabousia tangfeifanii]